MQKTINECVGCADGCHGCGKNKTQATICDECGEVCTELVFHDGSGDDLCLGCAVDRACADFQQLAEREKVKTMGYKEVTA